MTKEFVVFFAPSAAADCSLAADWRNIKYMNAIVFN